MLVHMESYPLSKKPSCKPIIIPIKVKDCDHTSIDADTKTLKETFKQLEYAKPEVFNQDSDRDTILNQLLNIQNCTGLRNKPKIFILQTDDLSISHRSPFFFGDRPEEVTRLPTQADSLIYHCSIPGFIETFPWSDSVKPEKKWNTAQGSKFIHTFCNEIRKERGIDIHQLTFKVNASMKEYVDDINSRKLQEQTEELSKNLELPICTSQLLRKFTLCQGQKETEV
ncbi:uncharacterized protein LOC143046129 [Mytilus galloprovincialis]|uniref:uncharacterized protein LOC143046129 n=1 Tax=Mytilus galloprovincialis TaxID=29158 RepID=UPI003F7B3EF5